VASAVTRVVPARARGGAPVTPATAPGERDLAPYADASSYIEFSTARSPEPRSRTRSRTARPAPEARSPFSSAALSSALERSVMSTPEKYQSVSNTHAETPTRYDP
jgi:hypothetical protein